MRQRINHWIHFMWTLQHTQTCFICHQSLIETYTLLPSVFNMISVPDRCEEMKSETANVCRRMYNTHGSLRPSRWFQITAFWRQKTNRICSPITKFADGSCFVYSSLQEEINSWKKNSRSFVKKSNLHELALMPLVILIKPAEALIFWQWYFDRINASFSGYHTIRNTESYFISVFRNNHLCGVVYNGIDMFAEEVNLGMLFNRTSISKRFKQTTP